MKYFLPLLFFIVISVNGQNQPTHNQVDLLFNNVPEIIVKFRIEDKSLIPVLSTMLSIDKVDGNEIIAYVNKDEFLQFSKLGIPFQIVQTRTLGKEEMNMMNEVTLRGITAWDFYPTYSAYLSMMDQFATQYPALCQVFSIGTSVQGRQIMMAKISDNVGTRESEPQFLYTGTIHGDELTGYILLLRLIDYLLSNYGTNPKVTNLVNNLEIWINPLANPDGTYYGGNNTVANARRYNANNVDINRNFPDPEDGPHPDGKAWQPETLAFMQLAEDNHFVMSGNTHGGAEVMNYPWDTWPRLAADNNWWIFVCRQYVDTVHLYSPSTYMDFKNNGITNGYAWYTISGGRQDYMNYFHNCRELTMEISDIKKPTASTLPNYWNWNYRSLLNYMEQCTFGISGLVTNWQNGEPVKAQVLIQGHDLDNSFVYSDSVTGHYQRLLETGTYNLTFIADGFPSQTISGINVSRYASTIVNVELGLEPLVAGFSASETIVPVDGQVTFTNQSTGNAHAWLWQFEGGFPTTSNLQNPPSILYENPGAFGVKLSIFGASGDSSVLFMENYIQVYPEILISTGNIETCSSLFYDSGGENNSYQNNETHVMTFLAPFPGSGIMVDFLEFEIEPDVFCTRDWLKIYDGISTSAPLIGSFCGTSSPGQVTSMNDDGALTFEFHSNSTTTKPGWKALIYCEGDQHIQLRAGWNGISTFVQPYESDPEILFDDILDKVEIIQGNNGSFIPGQQQNSLGNWNFKEGYQIKLQEDVVVDFSGWYNSPVSIQLYEGWNLIPVSFPYPVFVESLIDGLTNQVIIIKESVGLQVYWPSSGIFTLQYLQPGNSYLMKISEDIMLTFPNSGVIK